MPTVAPLRRALIALVGACLCSLLLLTVATGAFGQTPTPTAPDLPRAPETERQPGAAPGQAPITADPLTPDELAAQPPPPNQGAAADPTEGNSTRSTDGTTTAQEASNPEDYARQCDGETRIGGDHENSAFGGIAAWAGCAGVSQTQWVIERLGFGDPGATSAQRLNFDGSGPGGRWFLLQYDMMRQVMLWCVVPLLVLACIHAVVARKVTIIYRAFFIGLPAATLGSVFLIQLLQLLANITDDLSAPFVAASRVDSASFYTLIAQGLGSLGALTGVSMMAQTIFGLMLALVAMFLYFILMMRDAAVYITALFMPIGLALFIWPSTAKYFTKMLQFTVAMILAKFIMIATLSLGLAALMGSVGGNAVDPSAISQQVLAPDGTDLIAGNAADPEAFDTFDHFRWIAAVLSNTLLFLLMAMAPNAAAKLMMSVGFGEGGRSAHSSLSRPAFMDKVTGINRAYESGRLTKEIGKHIKTGRRMREKAGRTSDARDVAFEDGVDEYHDRQYSSDKGVDLVDWSIPKDMLDGLGWDGHFAVSDEHREHILRMREQLDAMTRSQDMNEVLAARKILESGAENVQEFYGRIEDETGGRFEAEIGGRRHYFLDKFAMQYRAVPASTPITPEEQFFIDQDAARVAAGGAPVNPRKHVFAGQRLERRQVAIDVADTTLVSRLAHKLEAQGHERVTLHVPGRVHNADAFTGTVLHTGRKRGGDRPVDKNGQTVRKRNKDTQDQMNARGNMDLQILDAPVRKSIAAVATSHESVYHQVATRKPWDSS